MVDSLFGVRPHMEWTINNEWLKNALICSRRPVLQVFKDKSFLIVLIILRVIMQDRNITVRTC